MKIRCPKCSADVDSSKTTCPACGASTSADAYLAGYFAKASAGCKKAWHALWGGPDKVFTATCPRCAEAIPFNASECPLCKLPICLTFLFAWYFEPVLRIVLRIRAFADTGTPFQKWLVRFVYFIASVTVLWLVLIKAEAKFTGQPGGWLLSALAGVLYVSVSLLILPWLLPQGALRLLATTRPLFKLSLFINYVTAVLAVLVASDIWKVRSWLLLTTFLVSLAGAHFFIHFVHPTWVVLGETLDPQPDWKKRSTDYRGRSADSRTGKWS